MLEILAGRLLGPFIGVSLETFTGIIGTVLAGIAVGSAAGGRLADRNDPRALVGPILVMGGALTWLAPPLVSLIGPSVDNSPFGIVFIVALTFFAPAAVLSAISPIAAKMRLDDLGETGSVVGNLSAAGTTGALFGTFVTGFVLVAALPSRPIIFLLGAALVMAGLLLWYRLRGATEGAPALIVALLVPAIANLGVGSPCDVETAYACVWVTKDEGREGGRSLILDGLRNSYVDLDDYTYLEFEYMRHFAEVVETTRPGAIKGLHLGGAGFTFPRYLAAVRPGSSGIVLEIDDRLVELAQAELGLELGEDLQVVVDDARLSIRDQPTDGFDVIIADTFSGGTVPWHLTTREFMAELQRVLHPSGVLAMNVLDGKSVDFARAELATLDAVFENVALILPSGGLESGRTRNLILIASDQPIIKPEVAEGRFLDTARTRKFIDGARVLRDDFAPVEQLRQQP